MLVVAVIAVLGFGVPLALGVQRQYQDQALLTISEEAARAVTAVPADFARTADLPELPEPGPGSQVALYGLTGDRLVGAGPGRAGVPVTAVLASGVERSDRSELVVVLPVLDREQVVGAVRASLPESVVTGRTHRAWAAMAGLAVVVLLATGAFAVDRSRRLSRPLADLRSDADVIGAGGQVLQRRPTGVAEIDEVHDALAEAATRLNDALARERSFAADVTHQLRTPLASLRLALETEQLRGTSDDQVLEATLSDVDRMQQTVDDLVSLNRDDAGERDPHPLAGLLSEVADRWGDQAHRAGRLLRIEVPIGLPWIRVSSSAVRQILDVLVSNALRHGQGSVQVAGHAVGEGAVVSVRDEGDVVIDPAVVFQRRGPDATGTGIGMALARRLAEAEGLQLVVADSGPGVEIQLVLGGGLAPRRASRAVIRS